MTGASEVFADGMLDGRVVLVTGGGTGLGRAAGVELAVCGAQVVIAGRRADVLERAAADMGAATVAGDAREPANAEQIVRFALERSGASMCSSTTPGPSTSSPPRRSRPRAGGR